MPTSPTRSANRSDDRTIYNNALRQAVRTVVSGSTADGGYTDSDRAAAVPHVDLSAGGPPSEGPARGFAWFLAHLAGFRRFLAGRRQRRAPPDLSALSPHLLRDIGLPGGRADLGTRFPRRTPAGDLSSAPATDGTLRPEEATVHGEGEIPPAQPRRAGRDMADDPALRQPTGLDPAAPVIALHCSGGTGRQWHRLAASLAPRAVLAPNLYGTLAVGPWSGEARFRLGDEAQPILDWLFPDSGKVHLVGHSYGAALALHVARRLPDRVASLSLYEPTAFQLLRDGAERDAICNLRRIADRMASGRTLATERERQALRAACTAQFVTCSCLQSSAAVIANKAISRSQ